jgi:hypothetical protein
MGKPTGFKEFTRELPSKLPVVERKTNYDCRSLKLLERRQQLSNWPIERGIFLR